MPPIGETLREARMRQKLDIADVESYTKIRAKYLRALENEEWGLLPGPTFVRTFLRTYAEAVGLDPHPLVDEYRRRHEPVEDPEPARPAGPARTGGGGRPRTPRVGGPPGPLAVLGVVAVLIVAVLLVLGLVSNDDDGNGGSGTGDQAAKTETTKTTAARKPTRKAAPRPRPAGVTLRIAPAVPTYACLDTGAGTKPVFEGILSGTRSFRNARELRLNLGKRQVKLTANGKAVKVAPSAEPYGLRVTRSAASEITNGLRPCA